MKGGEVELLNAAAGVFMLSRLQLLDLQIKAHIHPEQVNGNANKQQGQAFEVHR